MDAASYPIVADFLREIYIPLRMLGKKSGSHKMYRYQVAAFSRLLGRPALLSDLSDTQIARALSLRVAEGAAPATVNDLPAPLSPVWPGCARRAYSPVVWSACARRAARASRPVHERPRPGLFSLCWEVSGGAGARHGRRRPAPGWQRPARITSSRRIGTCWCYRAKRTNRSSLSIR